MGIAPWGGESREVLRNDFRAGLTFALTSLALLLAGCGGGGGGSSGIPRTPPPVVSQPQPFYTAAPADVAVGAAPVPSPFEPGNVFTAAHAARHAGGFPRRDASTDHEAQGVFLGGYAPPYNALFATQSVYEALQRPMPLPAGASGGVQAYAPTLHLGWGGCLEASSFYETSSAGATAQFTVYDLCLPSPTLVFSSTIDAAFLHKYVRLSPDGTPSYTVEMFTPDTFPGNNSAWTALLYDYPAAKYDTMVTLSAKGATAPDAASWSVVELYDSAGVCPRMAPVSANFAAMHDALADMWDPVTPSMPDGVTASIGVQGGSANACFLGSPNAVPTLNFSLLTPSSYWRVTSPR